MVQALDLATQGKTSAAGSFVRVKLSENNVWPWTNGVAQISEQQVTSKNFMSQKADYWLAKFKTQTGMVPRASQAYHARILDYDSSLYGGVCRSGYGMEEPLRS